MSDARVWYDKRSDDLAYTFLSLPFPSLTPTQPRRNHMSRRVANLSGRALEIYARALVVGLNADAAEKGESKLPLCPHVPRLRGIKPR